MHAEARGLQPDPMLQPWPQSSDPPGSRTLREQGDGALGGLVDASSLEHLRRDGHRGVDGVGDDVQDGLQQAASSRRAV